MMILPYPHSSSACSYALRPLPGQEVFFQLHVLAQQHQLHTTWIADCTGSLTDVALCYVGQEDAALLNGTSEVISLNGTLEQSDEHLHLCISDPHDTVLDGHTILGCTMRTTLKLVVGSLEESTSSRQPYAFSGYDELYVSPVK